ncbi:SDR family NAD(P)-dependent oxidoreductase [Haliangium sp.]|uniref:SDR family NAD(P)-dependent oxidoreductase n=1 Tax=Haliangium sp. TaxID=2663208 RepID=UPI003D141945
MKRFEDKVVVITGASAGIGAEVARRFAAEGAKLALAARGREGLERMRAELAESTEVIAMPTDVADPGACEALLAHAAAELGGVHVLVNNAGFNSRGAVEEVAAEELARIVDVNLRAPIVLSRLALPYLRRSGGGAIINVASLAGHVPLPDEATYSATKFGLRAFTYALAEEVAGTGITASVVSPGPVETGFLLDELDTAPDLVFSQPMSTADEIAALVVACAADGRVERSAPRLSGYLATLAYLFPSFRRAVTPVMELRGRRAKDRWRRRRGRAQESEQ